MWPGTAKTCTARFRTTPSAPARPPQARRDSEFALAYVKENAKTSEQQALALKALEFKCDVLWVMLDALYHAYVSPKHISPGAFVPAE